MLKVTCIDVSTFQKNVDYKKVKSAGIEAVIIRAGYGRETHQKDVEFETHYKNAKAAGLKIGAYWYSYADSVSDAEKEAKACLTCVKGKSFDMPIYYDLEDCSMTHLGKSTLTSIAKKFCDTVKSAGYGVGVYANLNWFNNYLNYDALRKSYSIWLAQYNNTNQLSCDIWQNSSTGNINGVSGNVDTNIIFNKDIIKLNESSEDEMKKGNKNLACLTFKQLILIMKELGLISQGVDDNNIFGDGTEKACKEIQKKAGYAETGVPDDKTVRYCHKLIKEYVSKLNTKITNAKKALS